MATDTTNWRQLAPILFCTLALTACGSDGKEGEAGAPALVNTIEAPLSECPLGGYQVATGTDKNRNNTLDANEITSISYICHGNNGQTGAQGPAGNDGQDGVNGLDMLVATTTLPAGDVQCPAGGVRIDTGLDLDRSGTLDAASNEIQNTTYVCNGQDGQAGADGQDGQNGASALVKSTVLPIGNAQCPAGGYLIETGVDANHNGQIESGELVHSDYVCHGQAGADGQDGNNGNDGADGANGADGNDGLQALINVTAIATGAQCPAGGYQIDTGLDTSKNGVLDASEITSTSYICHGEVFYRVATQTNDLNGSISPANPLMLSGEIATFTITPSTGTRVISVTGCGGTYDNNTHTYTTAAIVTSCTVTATFGYELTEVTPVPTPSSNITPSYTFNSTQAGDITYGGSCSSATDKAVEGDNVITFNPIPRGQIYSDCTITVENESGLISDVLAVTAFEIRYTLNDTGITTCGDYAYGYSGDHNNNLDCAGLPVEATATDDGTDADGDPVPAGQDAHFGRDALAAKGQLAKIGYGPVGFDYTKLDANGDDLPEEATVWSCVRDNVTGLVWEVKTTDGGLHDMNHTYTWYSTTNNNGNAGTQNGGSCSGSNCDTQAFTQAVNAEAFCGFTDWRMPHVSELRQLLNRNRELPAISTELFPNTHSDYYWSASPFAYDNNYAWVVDFWPRSEGSSNKKYNYSARLVRGGQ